MGFNIETLKNDALSLDNHSFFEKYVLSDEVWYIDCYMKQKYPKSDITTGHLRAIFEKHLQLSNNSVFITGSAKFGFSLSKKQIKDSKGEREEILLPFNVESDDRKLSDIDIAVVSEEWFDRFWKLYRISYVPSQNGVFNHVMQETYRGYINEKNVRQVKRCRQEWNENILVVLTELRKRMRFEHDTSIRLYRTVWDFEDYTSETIKNLKKEIKNNANIHKNRKGCFDY